MGSDILAYQGPQPRIPPVSMLIVFGIFLTLFSGPAYNANGFRSFLRESGFLQGAEDPETLLAESVKIFQTMDVMLGAVVGLGLDWWGPRITHSFGYVFFGASLVLMMNWHTLWLGMLFQGCAAVFLLNSAIHLANLFEHGSNFAMSIISSTVEIGFILYPGLALAVTNIGIPPKVLVWTLVGVCGLGLVATVLLFPDEPFFPRSEQAKANLRRASMTSSSDEEVVKGLKADRRDNWGDPESIIPNESRTTIPMGEKTPLVSTGLDVHEPNRLSRMSVSVVAMMERDSLSSFGRTERRIKESFLSQLFSPEWLLITLIFTFFVFRANLYLDSNEQILKHMGDADGHLIQMLAYLMPFSFIAALLNGALIELFGILPMAMILNACGIGVNLLSMTQWLDIQKLTFILFIFARASCWNLLFSYTLGALGLRHFGLLTGISLMFCGIINFTCGTWILRYAFHAGAQQWYWINWALTIGGFITFVALFVLWLLEHSQTSKKRTFHHDKH